MRVCIKCYFYIYVESILEQIVYKDRYTDCSLLACARVLSLRFGNDFEKRYEFRDDQLFYRQIKVPPPPNLLLYA